MTCVTNTVQINLFVSQTTAMFYETSR